VGLLLHFRWGKQINKIVLLNVRILCDSFETCGIKSHTGILQIAAAFVGEKKKNLFLAPKNVMQSLNLLFGDQC